MGVGGTPLPGLNPRPAASLSVKKLWQPALDPGLTTKEWNPYIDGTGTSAQPTKNITSYLNFLLFLLGKLKSILTFLSEVR